MGVARVQDSATGVFLSADSLISDPGYTQSYNRYGYVNNNPLSYNDPSGHCPHNNGCTPPDNNGPGYELEEVVVYAYIDDSRSADSSSWDFTPFDWALLRDWYNDFFNSNNVDSSPAKRAPVPQTQKPDTCKNAAQANRTLGDKVSDAVVGFGDAFLIPIIVRDLLDIDGGVDYDSTAYSGGKIAGIVWGAIPLALKGAAAYCASQAARGTPSILNANRYLRIGPGRWGGEMVPRMSSKYLPGDGHVNLSSRLPPIPPAGAFANASNCP